MRVAHAIGIDRGRADIVERKDLDIATERTSCEYRWEARRPPHIVVPCFTLFHLCVVVITTRPPVSKSRCRVKGEIGRDRGDRTSCRASPALTFQQIVRLSLPDDKSSDESSVHQDRLAMPRVWPRRYLAGDWVFRKSHT